MGANACSSKVFARPSQKKDLLNRRFIAVGVLRTPFLPATPILTADVSANAYCGLF